MRSHYCGAVTEELLDQEVTLCGWVNRRRDHGGVIFIDLRDRWGLVQLVADPEASPEAHAALGQVRNEWVIQVEGVVNERPADMVNPNLDTGEIEVEVHMVNGFDL